MKHGIFVLAIGLSAAAGYAADGDAKDTKDAKMVEQIIAKVNGDIITQSEIAKAELAARADLEQRGIKGPAQDEAIEERRKDFLRDRIDQLLLVQKGKELNINLDAEVSKYLSEIQLQFKIPEQEKFQDFIRQQTGMLFEDYRNDIRNSMLTQRVIRQEVGGRINIPRSEVQEYYDKHKDEFMRDERIFLREILISTQGMDEAATAAAEKKAKDLVARARKGEKFGEMARDNSDAVTARNYGDLGGYPRKDLRKDLADLLFAQERGYVTDPIKQDNGFLILKIEERHQAGLAPIEEVENEIMEKLYTPRFQPKVREYLTQLRQEAFLEIKEGYVDSSAAPGKDTAWSDPAELRPETVSKEEVALQTRRRRLLWLIPIPGTETASKSSSK